MSRVGDGLETGNKEKFQWEKGDVRRFPAPCVMSLVMH
jgi:hypothetical protein